MSERPEFGLECLHLNTSFKSECEGPFNEDVIKCARPICDRCLRRREETLPSGKKRMGLFCEDCMEAEFL